MKRFKILYPLIICLPISMVLIMMIALLCYERNTLNQEAFIDIASKWGDKQLLEAPFIISSDKKQIYMPETLDASAIITPEIRYRGIHEFVIYTADIQINAKFLPSSKYIAEGKLHEYILLGFRLTCSNSVNNIKASIDSVPINFSYDSNLKMFTSKVSTKDFDKYGTVKISLNLRGATRLHIAPYAKTNTINITSNWGTPSFSGDYLPTSREISKDKFSGTWNINSFTTPSASIKYYENTTRGVGVDLLMPIDIYRQTNRAISYSFLFITIFIVSIIATEYFTKERLDIIQYILAAVTPVVFYLMVLSFAEHIGFNAGFSISALLCSVLIACYIGVAISKLKVGITIFAFNMIAYAVMFILLYLENISLLVGSIVVFIILAILMAMTAKANKSIDIEKI